MVTTPRGGGCRRGARPRQVRNVEGSAVTTGRSQSASAISTSGSLHPPVRDHVAGDPERAGGHRDRLDVGVDGRLVESIHPGGPFLLARDTIADLLRRLSQPVPVAAREEDPCSFTGQCRGDRPPDRTAAADHRPSTRATPRPPWVPPNRAGSDGAARPSGGAATADQLPHPVVTRSARPAIVVGPRSGRAGRGCGNRWQGLPMMDRDGRQRGEPSWITHGRIGL